jgi:hypothetical protein
VFLQAMWHASQRGQPTLLPSTEQHGPGGGSNAKRLLSALTIRTVPPEVEQKHM